MSAKVIRISHRESRTPSSPPPRTSRRSTSASATPRRKSAWSLPPPNPFRIVEVKEGDTLIDLGSGAGFDCFLASHKVGRKGRVIGVDMTPEMLSLARRTAKENRYRNVEFRLGEIENLPAADNLADVVISNCVINLSQNKPRVYREILRVLKPGGAIGISDIVIMKELPKEIKQDDQMYAC